jgi:hypothetical protein
MENKILVEFMLDDNNIVCSVNIAKEILNTKNYFYKNLTRDEYLYYGSNFLIKNFSIKNEEIVELDKNINVENEIKKKNIILQIQDIKITIFNSDYKITKCYEAFMRQLPLPYNLEELSAQRDTWRAEINQLEQELAELE